VVWGLVKALTTPSPAPTLGRMGERTIPILPCRSIEENLGFYRALGFRVTFQQDRPNAYAVVARSDIELHFFAMKAYEPTESYSTCYITTTDVDGLYDAFRRGLRAALGRVPTRGLPRIGPLKDMSYGVRQFLVTDPALRHNENVTVSKHADCALASCSLPASVRPRSDLPAPFGPRNP
jgi:catechol 2,3-dioxygenase-like lactoylglutathione lyase family enzyme